MYGSHWMFTADHERFKTLLGQYVAMRDKDPDRAAEKWRQFSRSLRAHAHAEEAVLFPAYESNVHPSANGPIDDLRAQHRELLRLLDGLDRGVRVDEMRTEREGELMKLLWAHEARENALFMPWMRACLSATEREHLNARLVTARDGQAGGD